MAPDKALAFLARLASEFTTVLSMPDLLEHVIHGLHEEIGFDSCALALLDERPPGAFVIEAASGIRAGFRGLVVPPGRGLHGHVLSTGLPLLVPDMAADPRVYRREPGIRSGIYAPLIVHGHIIGVLSAHRSRPHAFTDADLDLLTVVARYLAGAIEVARLHDRLKDLAATDPLTGLANRRTFLERLAAEIARSLRTHRHLSVALLDLNGFKAINDAYGHAAGDRLLIEAAKSLTESLRASDLAARYGGDEFVLLLPEANGPDAEMVLTRFETAEIAVQGDFGSPLSVRFSWGIATWPKDGGSPDELLVTADSRLYTMKRRGQEHGLSTG